MKPVTINFKLTNVNNSDCTNVILRKFFNMCFISGNGKEMHIYTAIAFGGMGTVSDQKYVSDKCSHPCALNFEFSSKESCKIIYEDYSNKLLEQSDELVKVWADKNDSSSYKKFVEQVDLGEKIKDVFGISCPPPIDVCNNTVYFYSQKKENHTCFLIKGNYKKEKNGVKISVTEVANTPGFECINWIYTKIVFNDNILKQRIIFKSEFAGSDYFVPDFSWYIAPPEGYELNMDSSEVHNSNGTLHNTFQQVSDETTLNLNKWMKDEAISEIIKYRLLRKTNVIPYVIQKDSIIEKHIILKNPQIQNSRQFIFGIFFAFILSFFSETQKIERALLNVGVADASFLFRALPFVNPLLIALTYLCWNYKHGKKWVISFCKYLCTGLTILLQVGIFVISLLPHVFVVPNINIYFPLLQYVNY